MSTGWSTGSSRRCDPFTAAFGVPTLDGLGVDGHGAHSYDEHLLVSSLEPRARLMLRLFETLE